MQKVDNRFGFFAPGPPEKRVTPAVDSPLLLSDFVKCETDDNDEPADPVGQLTAKAQDDAACWKTTATATADYAQLASLLFAPADVRLAVAPLSKAGGPASDWSWSSPVSSTDTPLSKRAKDGTAKARFDEQLQNFFAGHNEEYWEFVAVVDEIMDNERAAILTEA